MIDSIKKSETIALGGSPMRYKSELRMAENGNLIIHVPMIIRRQRGRKIIVAPNAPDSDVQNLPDVTQNHIVQALARAFSWRDSLESGKIKSISALARKLNIDCSYVTRILKLTTLAPDIINAIISGTEPKGLSLAKLVKSFPEDWYEQRKLFRFGANNS